MSKFHTPPTLARLAGVANEKIIAFIASGELRAINLSEGTRPRWRVSDEDWQSFLARKSNQPPIKPTKRRSVKKSEITEFYK